MERKITIHAPAKINLFLDITERLENGFHNINSIMQTVDLYDTITITAADNDGLKINLTCDNEKISCGKDNLAYIAAEMFCNVNKITGQLINIDIIKRIPLSAGLAGGSTDAAAVLIMLNKIFDTNLDLFRLGVNIGADVPFCLTGGTAIAKGIGEKLKICPAFPHCYIIILIDNNQEISTKWAYERYDESNIGSNLIGFDKILKEFKKQNLQKICGNMYNVFEKIIIPDKLKDKFDNFGALGRLMSGSGPAIFGIFDDKEKAQYAYDQLKIDDTIKVFLCEPVSRHGIPLHI
ncbi:MAG: 4-(cytidine 5'-diphospho)-2-C-methyl-D-erythritol kinase [Oscillospiraceae bacterium]|nr:4-(cytidine 5'-diphospho)-2-C-methyl-D-erythritol kinase [Oscillospiraceae bacterium]